MSKLEELIKEKCPNGVKYLSLAEIVRAVNIGINPRRFFKLNPDNASGFYVTVRELNGLKGVKRYEKTDTINDEAIAIIGARANIEKGDILFSNTGTVGKLALVLEGPKNWGVNEGIYVIKPKFDMVLSKFLYYYLDSDIAYKDYSSKFTGSTLKHVTQAALLSIKVPVPPLEVQDEIVQILDNFAELTAELTAELSNRKKQYEYYRNLLLHFDENTERERVGLIMKYEQPGKYIVKSTAYSDNYKTPVLTAGQSFILGYTDETDNIFYASKENPVIIFDDFTTSFHWVDFNFKVKSSAVKMLRLNNSENISLRYVYYAMQCINYTPGEHSRQWISKYSNFEIPLPDRETQDRIVGILDNFDSIASSLSEGLPAEIEAREKQYAYYRDKLLTFEEAK